MHIGKCHGLRTTHSVKLNVGKTGDKYQDYTYHKNQKFKTQHKCYECGSRCNNIYSCNNDLAKQKKCQGPYSHHQGKSRGRLMRDTSRTIADEIADGLYIYYEL